MKNLAHWAVISIVSLVFVPNSAIAQGMDLGELSAYSTMNSIGIEWAVTGDENHNATCTVSYRAMTDPDSRYALPLYRVDSNGYDMLAGSILFLEPGSSYEITLAATDPDGGSFSEVLVVETRPLPVLPSGGPVYHVVPGANDTGGTGTQEDPFLGISAADNFAAPGVVFLLHAGQYPTTGNATYNGFTRFDEAGTPGNHVVWKSAGDGEVVFTGGAWIEADYVWLEGISFAGPGSGFGLLTYQNATGGVVQGNSFTGYYQSINLEHANDFYIADNTIVGVNDPEISDFGGEGIEGFLTSGHVIAHNRISRVGDGISVGGSNIDIFGNDIFDTSDDGIEFDHSHNNVRAWQNRIHAALHYGISFQPMDGAPWYVLRNQVAGPNSLKLVDNPTLGRVLVAHNTFVGRKELLVSFAHELEFVQANNNLWIHVTPGYIWEAYGDANTHWRTNLDYNGFYWHPGTNYPFYWGRTNYRSFAAFQAGTGLEPHGVVVDIQTCFAVFDLPLTGPVPPQHMTLASGSRAIDAGIALHNINDGFAGDSPDLGAFEYGEVLPTYGPRPADTGPPETLPPGQPGQPLRLN